MKLFNNKVKVNLNNNVINKFNNLKDENELMDFMNDNITYGWLDNKNNIHINNLKDVRKLYKISSIEETLKYKVGTCIEQAKVIKRFFDNNNIDNKVFCHRSYEDKDNIVNDVRMHCIVLFNKDGIWYHFEHSDFQERGIHKYNSIKDALVSVTSGFSENDIRVLTEIPDMPDGLSFKEFNDYVNSYGEYNIDNL